MTIVIMYKNGNTYIARNIANISRQDYILEINYLINKNKTLFVNLLETVFVSIKDD